MTLTTHAAVGIIVAQWTDSILIGFLFAIASHYLTDAIPHGDEFIYWRFVHNSRDRFVLFVGGTDICLLVIISLIALNSPHNFDPFMVAAGVIGGVLPDALVSIYTKRYKLGAPRSADHAAAKKTLLQRFLAEHYSFHMFFHNTLRIPIRFSTAVGYQAVFLMSFVYFFLLN